MKEVVEVKLKRKGSDEEKAKPKKQKIQRGSSTNVVKSMSSTSNFQSTQSKDD